MDESAVTIRPAGQEDLPAVAEMCQAWAGEILTRNYRPDSAEQLRGRLGECFLVAELARRVVGFVIGEIRSTENNEFVEGVLDDEPAYLEVQDLYVTPERRGRGLGGRLVRTLLDRAAAMGVTGSLVYSANRDYLRTARFYEKLGYQMWHIHMTRKR